MYYFHGNCRKCTEKIVGDLVREGKTRFIIYGFGDAGMKVKSILNVCMGIQEHLVVDDSLAGRYRNIKSLAGLTAEDLKDAVVLVASDEDTVYNDMGEPEDAYSRFRADLYRHVPKEQCVELFPRPRRVLEAFRIGDMRVDLESALRLAATEQTAEFIMENLIDTPRYADRYELLEHILCDELSADPGLMLEFGVFSDPSVILIGLVYIVARSLGKYLGAGWSSAIMHSAPQVRKWLGITLLPQAGVALGMCATAYRVLGGAEGTLIRNIILFSVLIYELIGPSLTKMALTKAGDIQAIPAEVKGRRKKQLEEVTKPVPAAFDK